MKYSLERDKTLLLVVDIQERLADVMEMKDKLVKKANIMIKAFKELDMPIIVTEQYPKGLGKTLEELGENLEGAEFFEKLSFSAYQGEIKDRIDQAGYERIVIVGMETHVCVYQTVRDLVNQGLEVYVALDGVTSRSRENYRNGLELIERVGGIVTNTETILFDLLKTAEAKEFKYLSSLIK